MSTKFNILEGTVIEDFESISGFNQDYGTRELETTIVKSGSGALKLTSVEADSGYTTKTVSWDLSAYGTISLWIYIPSLTGLTALTLYLASQTNFATFFSKYIDAGLLHEGWNKVLIARDEWQDTGGEDWANTMVRFRVRIDASAGTPYVIVDEFMGGEYERPKLLINFDDSHATQYTVAFAEMNPLKIRGTLYIIPSNIDNGGMTTAQVQEMYDAGWDICVHDSGNWRDEHDNATDVQTDIQAQIDFIRAKGWDRQNSALHAAYPEGGYDDDVFTGMAGANMKTGRSIIELTQAHDVATPYLLTRELVIHTDDANDAIDAVNNAVRRGGACMINFHQLVDTPTVSTQFATAEFQTFIKWVARHDGTLFDVVPLTEWYEGLTQGRKLI